MANIKTLDDLPVSKNLPAPDELVVPVFKNHSNHVICSISVHDLAQAIQTEVLKNLHVNMQETPHGIRFWLGELRDNQKR